MSASVLKVPTKCERTAARRKIWRRWERAGLGPSRPQQTFERRQRGCQRAVALGQLATVRGNDDLWADVIASATAAGGQRALVEAAAVIAKSAQRIPKRLFNLLTSRQARWHPLVVTALEHLAQWLDGDQVEELRAWAPFGEAAARLWPEAEDAAQSDHAEVSQAALEAAPRLQAMRAAAAAEMVAAINSAHARLAAHLRVSLTNAPAGEIAHKSEPPVGRALPRLVLLESMADRAHVALRAIAAVEPGNVSELMDGLRGALDPQRWGEAVDAAWDRWVAERSVAAVNAALALTDLDLCARLLARTPSALLQPARAPLHSLWQQRLADMRQSRRADALTNLIGLAPVVECLAGEPALLQAMDDVQSTCTLWP